MFCCLRCEKEDEGPKRLKMVVVGDGDCGKTCLLYHFAYNEFFTRYIPTVFEIESKTVYYKEKEIDLVMFDTAGQEDFDRLRPISYNETDVMVICFSLDNPDSLENVQLNWLPEVRHYCGDIPILLVGTKKDLRASAKDAHDPIEAATDDVSKLNRLSAPKIQVTYQEGVSLASTEDAVGYFETSAKTGEGVDALFEAVIRAGMEIQGEETETFRSIQEIMNLKLLKSL